MGLLFTANLKSKAIMAILHTITAPLGKSKNEDNNKPSP